MTSRTWRFFRHCEERSDEAIHFLGDYGLLRYARNDKENTNLNSNPRNAGPK
jgi:hypothetical protein